MAYIFDPLRNTFIDYEDTSLGNKLALVDDDELDKAIRELDEKFGTKTIKTLNELPENKPKEVEDTEAFNRFNKLYQDGGFIGGGTISGEDYGDRTGFAKPQLIIGGSRTDPKFRGKYGVRTGLTVPADTPGYLGRTGEQAVFATEADAQRFIDEDIRKLFLESQASKKRSPVIEARLEKIKQIYKNLKKLNPKKIFLDDIIDQLAGEKTVFGTGKRGIQKEQTALESRTTFKGNIREALGQKIYDTLIKSQATDPRELDAKQVKFNKLVLDVNRGDLPLRALGSEARGTKQNIKMYLTEPNKKRFDKLLPQLRAINSRVIQPAGTLTKKGINELKKTTTKNFNAMMKKYPSSIERRTSVFKGGTRFYDAKSYILALIGRHVTQGGTQYKHVGGDTMKDVKFRNTKTNKLITIRNMDLTSSEFKEAAEIYDEFQKLKNTKVNNPINNELIPLNNAIKLGSNNKDYLIIDHTKGIKDRPLNDLIITTQKQNIGFELAGLTDDEKKLFYRKKLSLDDNIKRFSKYADKIIKKKIDGEQAYFTPTETVEKYRTRINNQLNSGIPIDTIITTLADDLDLPVEQIKNVAGKTLRGLGKAATVIDPVFAAFDESRAQRRGAGSKDTTEYVVDSFVQGVLNLPRALEDVAYLATEEGTLENFGQKEDRFFDYDPFTFAEKGLEKNLQKTSMDERVSNVMSDIASGGGYRSPNLADPEYLKIFESLSKEDVENMLKDEDTKNKMFLPQEVKPDQTLNQFLADGGRVGFSNGGAAGADDDFAAQLEYYFLNPDAELPAAQTFRETMNPISIVNDMIDPRNIPYYADRLVQSGIRIGEFGARVLPAVGQLAADLIQKPAFKIKPASGQGYVQDYADVPPPSNITGTGIFSEFLNNLVGDEGTKVITEKTGLAKLIKDEEQKMKDERKTAGAKILADQFTLGMELTAPIFPGYKLLQAYAKSRKLPVDKATREVMDKEIDEVLTQQGISRRDFMKVAGAGGAVAIAKLLGVGDEFATVTKVAEKAVPKGPIVPPYFFKLVDKIKRLGTDESKRFATMDREVVYVYKDYELYEDLTTGNIRINKKSGDPDFGYTEEEMVYTKGIGDESTQGTPADEYDEFTVRPDEDGKMKDVDGGLDDIEGLIDEIGVENISIKDLEAMGYDIDRLPVAVQRKLGIKKPVSPIDKALKNSDDDLPDLPF